MQFANRFEVSLPPEEAWPLLMDVREVVPCMPGAELVEVVDERTFKGKVSVRLGPVNLVFLCDARFEDVDAQARTATVQATGSDAKGRGGAQATIGFRCQPCAAGSLILIDTDLALSGTVAQYGRGVGLIQNVANQIIRQFAANLEARIAQRRDADGEAAVPGMPPPAGAALSGMPDMPAAAAAAAGGDFLQVYRQGYMAGFAAGHLAGYGAAAELLRQGRDPLASRHAGPARAQPIGGFSLFFASLWATVRGWFGRRPS